MKKRNSWHIRGLTVLVAALSCLILGPAPSAAAASGESDLQPHRPEGFDPAQSGLAGEPLVIEALGLAMYRPADSLVTSSRSGGQLVVTMLDNDPSPRWSMTIQHLHVASATTPELQIEDHLAGLQAAGREFRVLENRPFRAGELPGRLCYLEQPDPEGQSLASGWLILPAGEETFLVFSILSLAEDLPLFRATFESAFETINLRSAAEISLQRRSNIEMGRSFLRSITADELRPLIGLSQWSRIYTPDRSGTGEREIGYSLLEVYEARRGALNPDKPQSDYTPGEQAPGIMVRLQGRVIGDLERNLFFDSIALYWVSWDQSEEAWSVRGTQRQGQAERSESETGLRLAASAGSPRPTLTVIRQRASDFQRNSHDWVVPDVYLSQALGTLVGRLLAAGERQPRDMAYYFYNHSQATPQLTRRSDRWEPAEDGSGNWTLTTRLAADAAPIVSTYSADGQLLRVVRADGAITEPTTLQQLRQLWRSKGLPMGP